MSNLNMYSTANKMRLSGIVCTIGPVSREPATLLELIENGMNVARMNFSHGYVSSNTQSSATLIVDSYPTSITSFNLVHFEVARVPRADHGKLQDCC